MIGRSRAPEVDPLYGQTVKVVSAQNDLGSFQALIDKIMVLQKLNDIGVHLFVNRGKTRISVDDGIH